MTEQYRSRSQIYQRRFDEALVPSDSDFLGTNLGIAQEYYEAMYSDELTGLLNRRGFRKQVRYLQETLNIEEPGSFVAIVSCDLDNFKHINDTFGHDAGDTTLKCVADIITGCVREGDVVSRWGGDEFVIAMALHYSFGDVKPTDVRRAFDLAIKKRFQEAVDGGDPRLGLIGLSSGVEIGPASDLSGLSQMIDRADHTMLGEKQKRDAWRQRKHGALSVGDAVVALSRRESDKASPSSVD